MKQGEKKGSVVVGPPENCFFWNIWQIGNIWLQTKWNVLLGGNQVISLGRHFLQKPKESDRMAGFPEEQKLFLGYRRETVPLGLNQAPGHGTHFDLESYCKWRGAASAETEGRVALALVVHHVRENPRFMYFYVLPLLPFLLEGPNQQTIRYTPCVFQASLLKPSPISTTKPNVGPLVTEAPGHQPLPKEAWMSVSHTKRSSALMGRLGNPAVTASQFCIETHSAKHETSCYRNIKKMDQSTFSHR